MYNTYMLKNKFLSFILFFVITFSASFIGGLASISLKEPWYSQLIKSNYNHILEKQICKIFKCKYSLCLNSGTDALIIALKSLGLKNGDEILTTSNTWISSAYAISLNNCKPVFVDINEKYLQMDENLLKKKLTKRTKAIMVTHLYGNPSKMDYICKFAKKHKLSIGKIENYDDYKTSRELLKKLVGTKEINIDSFVIDEISYNLNIYGNFETFIKEISDSNFMKIKNIEYSNKAITADFRG